MVWDGVVGDGEAKGRTNNSWCSTRRLTHRFPDDVGMPGPGPEPTFRSQKGASLSGVRWYLEFTLISRRGVVAQDGGPRWGGWPGKNGLSGHNPLLLPFFWPTPGQSETQLRDKARAQPSAAVFCLFLLPKCCNDSASHARTISPATVSNNTPNTKHPATNNQQHLGYG